MPLELDAARIGPDDTMDTLRITTVPSPDRTPEDGESADPTSPIHEPADADWSLTTFLDCMFDGCRLGHVEARDARFTTVDWRASSLTRLRAPGASMFFTGFTDCRIGAFDTMDTVFQAIEFTRCKIGYLNLRGAKLRDVIFRECDIADFDAADATLERVAFADTAIGSIAAHGASIAHVDLRGARLTEIRGVADLAGVTMSADQIAALAVPIAASLGIHLHD